MTETSQLLAGKTVVVIGGAGLLGQTFSRGLVCHGAHVVVADIDPIKSTQVCELIRLSQQTGTASSDTVDITSKESLLGLIRRTSEQFGKIDAVVNSAYPRNRHYGRKLEQVEYVDFCENINLHLGGYFLSTQQFAEFFKAQTFGHVINISSIYGNVAPRFEIYDGTRMTMPVEYAAIKSAIQQLSLYFMRYYKGTKLRFNCISPGGILDGQPAEFLSAYKGYSQSQGMLLPEDMIGTLTYLISDLSQYVNGQNIIVDDGWSI